MLSNPLQKNSILLRIIFFVDLYYKKNSILNYYYYILIKFVQTCFFLVIKHRKNISFASWPTKSDINSLTLYRKKSATPDLNNVQKNQLWDMVTKLFFSSALFLLTRRLSTSACFAVQQERLQRFLSEWWSDLPEAPAPSPRPGLHRRGRPGYVLTWARNTPSLSTVRLWIQHSTNTHSSPSVFRTNASWSRFIVVQVHS